MLLQMDWWIFFEKLILIAFIVTTALVVAMYSTYFERKIAAWLQDRRGPSRAGPFGILQPIADGIKLFAKEEIIPTMSSKTLFIMGPMLAMITATMTSAVIPWSWTIDVSGRQVPLQIADPNIGILFIFGVVSLGVYGIMIGGWASNNKFSLIAAIRGASQMISYELAMGLSLLAVLMLVGPLQLSSIVNYQIQHGWNIIYQPLGFLIFFVCALAECNRTPFDLPEAENELNFGYHQEYSSMKLGFYLFAEYINMFMSGVVMATLFFGGYDIPFVNEASWGNGDDWWIGLVGFLVLMTKALFFVFLFMWIRWTIPRFRYDQLMNLGWKGLLPLALANMVITAVVVLLMEFGWPL